MPQIIHRTLYPEDLPPGSRTLCVAMRNRSVINTPFGYRLSKPSPLAPVRIHPASLAKLIGLGLASRTASQVDLTDTGRTMAKQLNRSA